LSSYKQDFHNDEKVEYRLSGEIGENYHENDKEKIQDFNNFKSEANTIK